MPMTARMMARKSERRAVAPAKKKPTKQAGTPAGEFAEFLLHKLATAFRKAADTEANQGRQRFSAALKEHGVKAGVDAIRKWEQGASSPLLKDFDGVAKAMGYSDWAALAVAVRRFSRR